MKLKSLELVLLTFALGLLALAAEPSRGSPAAGTGFRCGSGFLTYTVRVQPGSTGGGVRCVKFVDYQLVDGQMTGVYWYGEGTLNQYVYRHLGNIYVRTDPATGARTVVSLASDIYGNGENAEFSANDLVLTPIDGQRLIQETSEWPEQWVLEPSGVADYTSTLGPVTQCGQFFTKFTADGGRGVRCAMRSSQADEYPNLVWYGDSDRGARRHLGIVTGPDSQGARAIAVDFCGRALCPAPASARLRLLGLNRCGQPHRIRVSGAWNEIWRSAERSLCE